MCSEREWILWSFAGDPGPKESGAQTCVREGLWKRGAPALVSPVAPTPSFPMMFFFFFSLSPSALGFEWRWHQLASGSRRGSSWDSQDSGFSLHGVAGLTCAALALCSTVPRVTKAMSPFGRLATLESPFHSVLGPERQKKVWLSHSLWGGVPTPSHRFAVGSVEAQGHSALSAWTRPLLPSTARWRAVLLRWFKGCFTGF